MSDRLVIEGSFKNIVSKVGQSTGFNMQSQQQLDKLLDLVAHVAGVPVSEIRFEVETKTDPRSQDTTHHLQLYARNPYRGVVEWRPLNELLDQSPVGAHGPVDPDVAYNYWNNRMQDDAAVQASGSPK